MKLDLRFRIKDIKPEGKEIKRSFTAEEIDYLFLGTNVERSTPEASATLEMTIFPVRHDFVMDGTFSGYFHLTCSRCLNTAKVELPAKRGRLVFVAETNESAGENDGNEDLDDDETDSNPQSFADLDTYTHDGEVLDLEPALREILVLAIPIAPLCSESCRGLCPACGADLNREQCNCAGGKVESESPWVEALRQAKQKLKN